MNTWESYYPKCLKFFLGLVVLFGLYLTTLYSYLLFHSMAEIFSIVIAFGIFMFAWNSRRLVENNYLLFLGIGYLFVAFLDLIHTLAYPGMGIFKGHDTNLPTQLWIAARYVQSATLILAPVFIYRRLKGELAILGYIVTTGFLLSSIFYWHIFPDCFVESIGLTSFKKISEYIICLILLTSVILLLQKKGAFDKGILQLLVTSVIFTIGAEIAFTFYISAYGFSNMIGHLLKIMSFYLIYIAIINTGIVKPFNLLFRNLKQNEEELKKAHDELEKKVGDRTKELTTAYELLHTEFIEHKHTAEKLRDSEEKYRSILESIEDGYFEIDIAGNLTFFNSSLGRIIEYEKESLTGMNCREFLKEESAYHINQVFNELYYNAKPIKGVELDILSRTKSKKSIDCSVSLIEDKDGKKIGFRGMMRDITEKKNLEIQLQQSQKMEAIGKLAGGIAHDFNNLLTIIVGYSELVLHGLGKDHKMYRNVEEVMKAGNRSATLTRQLLAFSRRQILDPKIVNLNFIISEIEKMLRRMIGEDIELETLLSQNLGNIEVDPGQIDQVLMNLVVNARDAMPTGGKLTIETENVFLDDEYAEKHADVRSGSYILLSISDSGIGMSEEIRTRIFEPFFTTKEKGEGTGLGLAMVYGIVKQSGGFIWVYSEPGIGTTFKIYFPQVFKKDKKTSGFKEEITNFNGSETILLVEDEKMVRGLAFEVLKRYKYNVLEAENANEALKVSQGHQDVIDLLVTDVVMPGKSGKVLAEEIKRQRPGIKILFMSGYTDNAIVRHGILEQGTNFIHKPFRPSDLLRKIRELLDR